jgi:glycosyltransferase involved in cell wall biosynthesis
MKILHLTTHLNIGGIGKYVTSLAKALKRRGHTAFIASGGGDLEKTLSKEGIGHIELDIKTKSELSPKVIKSFFALKSFLTGENIDLIHAHTRVTQVVAALLSLYLKVPYVTTCHGFFKRRLGRRIFSCWGERVVAISEAVKNQLIGDFRVDRERIALIYTGIELDRFMQRISPEKKEAIKRRWRLSKAPVVGTIGRLSPVKGQDVLLKAAEKLVGNFSDIKVLLVGNGPDENRLKDLSATLGLKENVIFADSIEDTTEILPAIDIFVLPSIEEGLGLSLMEAMASGKPCIASRVGGIESLIEDGITGILFDPGDSDDLARAVRYVLNNSERQEAFKEAARKRVINEFDINQMASRMEKMYEEVRSA